jgi:hypothetical protein
MVSATVLLLLFELCKLVARYVELTFRAISQKLWSMYLKANILEVS